MKKQFLFIVAAVVTVTTAYAQFDYSNGFGRRRGGNSYPTPSNRLVNVQATNTANMANQVAAVAGEISQKAFTTEASDQVLIAVQGQLNAIAQQLVNVSRQLDNVVSPRTCVMYTEPGFQGLAVVMSPGEAIWNLSGVNINGRYENLNDQISSAAAARGCTLQMWEHKNFGGRIDSFNGPNANLQFDNFYTSAKCFCQ